MRLFVLGELLGVVLKNRGGCGAQPNPAGESLAQKASLLDSASFKMAATFSNCLGEFVC